MPVKTILGTMAIGGALDKEKSKELLCYYKERGYEELDSAIMYASGKTEVVLGHLSATKEFKVSTKVNPWFRNGKTTLQQQEGLTPDTLTQQVKLSLSRLQSKVVDILYLHAPDHVTPIRETLQAINQAYTEGKFKIFAVSNYSSWQVAEICEICKANGWVAPTIYQGMYNVFTRDVEAELFPCLRYYKLSFYGYNPLAGGILSGKYKRTEDPTNGRFSNKTAWGKAYRERFWNEQIFDAIDEMQEALNEHGVTILEAAIRWLYHHSMLEEKYNDGVILGASSCDHLKTNLNAAEAGPLHEDIVAQLNNIAERLSSKYPRYFR